MERTRPRSGPPRPLLVALLLASASSAGCGAGDAGPIRYRPEDPRAQALWDAPQRCGAPPYAWLDDPQLGEILETYDHRLASLRAASLTSILESVGIPLVRPLLYRTKVYRVRYMTQDRGELRAASGLLGFPVLPEGDTGPRPIVLYLHGTAGFNDACAPSGGIADPYLVAMLASLGYVVAAPDYLGLLGVGEPSGRLHPYVVSEPTAIASLDAARAARRFVAEGLSPPIRLREEIAVVGGSQGGHAALAVAAYGNYYAPELPIAAVAASVSPADLVGEGRLALSSLRTQSDNMGMILASMSEWYGADPSEIFLPPYDTSVVEYGLSSCTLGGTLSGATTLQDAFTAQVLASAAAGFPDDGSALSCMVRASSIPEMDLELIEPPPVLFVLAELDELVSTPLERTAFERLCDRGWSMEYLECEGATHLQGGIGTFAEQLDFIDARLAGEPWDPARVCALSAPRSCPGLPTLP
ncbi:MAG: alpha/beta fold hydrolase [Myxococcales bacterium]|nr:alpha/beta fold hydrolase [Myxococcales bacterium]